MVFGRDCVFVRRLFLVSSVFREFLPQWVRLQVGLLCIPISTFLDLFRGLQTFMEVHSRCVEEEKLAVVILVGRSRLRSFLHFRDEQLALPDAGVTIPLEFSHGYLIPFAVYGPMAVWPDVEFYSPSVNLVGYFSVGNVLLFVSFGLLAAFTVALFMRNIATRKRVSKGTLAPLGGAMVAALSTNACCCCSPAIYPVVAILFGGAVPSVIAESLVNPESPVSNLFVLITCLLGCERNSLD